MVYKTFWLCPLLIIILTTFTANSTIETEFSERESQNCNCLNGGTCSSSDKYLACNCPSGFVGTRCQTEATLISQTDQEFTIDQNYSYFYFQPSEINYYQIALKICLPQNQKNKLTNLVFLQVQRSSGKLKLQPSIYQTSPITFQGDQDSCQTFYTHFIPIRKKLNDEFQKIIFGVVIKNNSDSAANRWVSFLERTAADPQQSLRTNDISNDETNEDLMANQVQIEHQKVIISCTYELYLVENYWGTFIIIMSAITLFVSTGVFLYTIRNKYSYNLSNEDILRMYAINPQQTINQQNLKNDLTHFRSTMPIMSYELLVEKIKRNSNKQNISNQNTNNRNINKKIQQEKSKKETQHSEHFSPDELVSQHQLQQKNESNFQIQSTCTICLLNFEDEQKVRQTPCRHIFHAECIDNWCENTLNCPVCRQNLEQTGRNTKTPSVILT